MTRVKGPTDGPSSVSGVDPAEAVDAAEAVDKAEAVEATEGVEAVGAAEAAGGADPITGIAADLRSGKISLDQAVDALIEDTIHRKLGRFTKRHGDQVTSELRQLLRDYAANDPFLAAKIRQLSLSKAK
jgi:hypothetical protein